MSSWRTGILACSLFGVTSLGAQSYAARIDQKLAASGLNRNLWGVVVTDLQGRVRYAHNAEKLLIPASNAKLAVASTALALLGPDFAVNTSLYSSAEINNGELQGDLVLYGRGDPSFSRRCYRVDTTAAGACDRDPAIKIRELATQLQRRGIKRIQGDLIADGTWFEEMTVHPTWERYDLGWYFAAPVSALAFNDNALDIRTTAGTTRGTSPEVSIFPDLGFATFTTTATVSAAGTARTYDIFRSADGSGYRAQGVVPAGTTKLEFPAVADPDRFAAYALRAELQAVGITLSGRIRIASDSLQTLKARSRPALAEVASRPLRDLLFPILNASQNLFAEMLLKQLGRQKGAGGSWSAGLAAERRFLIDVVKVDSTQFLLVDGSGLSTHNLMTPMALTAILRELWARPTRELILSALPKAGEMGTLSRRFAGTPLAGQVHAKSGAMGGVNTLSGFITKPGGEVLVFSVIANNHTQTSAKMIAAIDSVVVAIGTP